MLIGISGETDQAKNNVAKIMQYLMAYYSSNKSAIYPTIDEFLSGYDTYESEMRFGLMEHEKVSWDTNWQIKAFEDKKKDILCILIGCKRQQLEDSEFLDTPLGKEWTKWRVDEQTVVNPLDSKSCEVHEDHYYFSTEEEANKYAERNTLEARDYESEAFVEKEEITPRKLFQLLEKECGIHVLHPVIWINALFTNYTEIIGYVDGEYWCKCKNCAQQYTGDKRSFLCPDCYSEYPNWIIRDVKTVDQFNAIKNRNGYMVTIGDSNEEDSALYSYQHDFVIPYDQDLDSLVSDIEKFLENLKLGN